jgi:hypothetical protein
LKEEVHNLSEALKETNERLESAMLQAEHTKTIAQKSRPAKNLKVMIKMAL